MSFKSKIYTAVIAFSLAVIVAVIAARRIEEVWFNPYRNSQEFDAEEEAGYYPFLDEAEKAPQGEAARDRMLIAADDEEAYVPEKQMQKPFFGGQIDLPALAKEQEVYIHAEINEDRFKSGEDASLNFGESYNDEPELKRFFNDMRKALGEDAISGKLSPQELTDRILNNPQTRKILLEYSKDPKIMQITEDILKETRKPQDGAARGSGDTSGL